MTRVVIDTGVFAAGFYLMNLDTAKTRQDTISSPGEHSHSIETASGQHEHCPVVHLEDTLPLYFWLKVGGYAMTLRVRHFLCLGSLSLLGIAEQFESNV